MESLNKVFNAFSSALESTPQIVGLGAIFYLTATTFLEVSITGVPFWTALSGNAQQGIAAVFDAGSQLIH